MSLIFTFDEFPIELDSLNNGAYDFEYFDAMKNIKTSEQLLSLIKDFTKMGTNIKSDINIKKAEIEVAI